MTYEIHPPKAELRIEKKLSQQEMVIFNEHFTWYEEGGQYFITHPKWSLVGAGKNLQDAHRDLLKEINITRIHCNAIPDSELTEEALRMKQWLLPIKVKNSE